jgi:hypothetical protein
LPQLNTIGRKGLGIGGKTVVPVDRDTGQRHVEIRDRSLLGEPGRRLPSARPALVPNKTR